MADIQYKIDVASYSQNTQVKSDCNAITFYNSGTVDVKINTIPIPAGQTFSIEGNNNEIDRTLYIIDFGSSTSGTVFVIRKVNF